MVERRVEEDHVRLATQPGFVQGLARRRIDGDECTLIARAEQTAALRIDVEAVRPLGRYRIGRSNSCRVVCFHDNDHGWLRDVDEEALQRSVEKGPPCPTRNLKVRRKGSGSDIN